VSHDRPVTSAPIPAERGFAAVAEALATRPGVQAPVSPGSPVAGLRSFGSAALRVDDRIFAMVSRGRLVLKLPARRVAGLIASGRGTPYDAGKGRPMREWVGLEPERQDDWLDLATEALEFVRSRDAGRHA
jgi:TfoX/Sxy family transcriptional regulator of competence genes